MATAARLKKWVASSKSPESASARSKPKRCAKCDTRPGSGSSKVSWKHRERKYSFWRRSQRNFRACRQFNWKNMKPEDDQELWDLLGRVPGRDVSPFFARNVLRQIREAPEASPFERVRRWISLRRLIPATALAVAAMMSIIAIHHPVLQRSSQNDPDVVA